tara:strand:- start:252 stop:1409 length:1158 start_codon:yes stop_codon:yes gene_type:complete
MKILHIGKYYPPNFGGIESVTKDIAENFAKGGDKVTVLCFSKDNLVEQIKNVTVVRCKANVINRQPISISYIYNFFRLKNKSDIIHIHLPNYLALFCSLFISKKKKLILHWHSDVLGFYFWGSILRIFEIIAIKSANKIIFTSPNYINGSYIRNLIKNKFNILPISVSVKSKKTTIKKNKPNKLKILFVGRLVPYKGLDVLIKSLRLITDIDIELNIVGSGNKIYKHSLTNLASASNHSINFLGKVDDLTLESQYLSSDVLVLPSTYRSEAFGVVILEAFSYGLPCISSNLKNSGLSWINKNNKTGLKFETNDHYDLAEKIKKFIDLDEKKYIEMQNYCLKEARKKYSHYKMKTTLEEIYNNLFDDNNPFFANENKKAKSKVNFN